MLNTNKISEIFERCNDEYQNQNTGLSKLISVHGNRLLFHLVFQDLKSEDVELSKEYVEITEDKINGILLKNIESVKKAKEDLFPDVYPANIFKNATRCKEIKNKAVVLSDYSIKIIV